MPWKDPVSGLVSADKSVFTTGAGAACGALSPANTSGASSYSVQTCPGKRPASERGKSLSNSGPGSKKVKEAVADTLRGLHEYGIEMNGYDELSNTICDEKGTDITTTFSRAEIQTLRHALACLQNPVASLNTDNDDLLNLTGKNYHELSTTKGKSWKCILAMKNPDGSCVFEKQKLKDVRKLHRTAQNQATSKKSKWKRAVNTIISDAIRRNLPEIETSTTCDALSPADTGKAPSGGLLASLRQAGIKMDGYNEKAHTVHDTKSATVKLSTTEMDDLQQAYTNYQKPICTKLTTDELATLNTTGLNFEDLAQMTRSQWKQKRIEIVPENGLFLSEMEKNKLASLRRKAKNMTYSRKFTLKQKVHKTLLDTASSPSPITEKRPETPPPEMPSEQP